jgi:hypothetical protein
MMAKTRNLLMDPATVPQISESLAPDEGSSPIAWAISNLESHLGTRKGSEISSAQQVAWEIVKARLLAGHQMLDVVDLLANAVANAVAKASDDPIAQQPLLSLRISTVSMRDEMSEVIGILEEGS